MAINTPGSTVPLGQADTGSAFVLDQRVGLGPLNTLIGQNRYNDVLKARDAKEKREQLAKREKEALEWKLQYAEQDTPAIGGAKSNFLERASKLYVAGKKLDLGTPEYAELLKYRAEMTDLADRSLQQKDTYSKIMQAPEGSFGKYFDAKNYKKDTHIWYVGEDGTRTVVDRRTAEIPATADPKYFRTSAYLDDKVKNLPLDEEVRTKIQNGRLGQLYIDTQDSFRFTTRDQKGNLVPGIDQEHVDYFLKDNEYRQNVGYRVNQALKQEAEQLRASGDTRDEQEILDDLAISGKSIDERINETVKADLEAYQERKYSSKIRSGMRYPTPRTSSSKADKPKSTVSVNTTGSLASYSFDNPATGRTETQNRYNRLESSIGVNSVKGGQYVSEISTPSFISISEDGKTTQHPTNISNLKVAVSGITYLATNPKTGNALFPPKEIKTPQEYDQWFEKVKQNPTYKDYEFAPFIRGTATDEAGTLLDFPEARKKVVEQNQGKQMPSSLVDALAQDMVEKQARITKTKRAVFIPYRGKAKLDADVQTNNGIIPTPEMEEVSRRLNSRKSTRQDVFGFESAPKPTQTKTPTTKYKTTGSKNALGF